MDAATPKAIQRPKLRHTFLEVPRVMQELGCLAVSHRWIKNLPGGEGQPVMVLPGFSASDSSTFILRAYLKTWGYQAHPWGLGANMNPREIKNFDALVIAKDKLLDAVEKRLREIHKTSGQKISLIGWSLGGIFSRLVASRHPDLIRQVITLGTPFGDPRAVAIYPMMERIHKQSITESQARQWQDMCDAPVHDTPFSIIYSNSDGFVSPQIAIKDAHDTHENIHVCSSHVGFIVNPLVLYVVANRLAQPEKNWQSFQPEGIGKLLYA